MRAKGFTLLEVLVALAVLGLLSGLLAAGVRLVLHARTDRGAGAASARRLRCDRPHAAHADRGHGARGDRRRAADRRQRRPARLQRRAAEGAGIPGAADLLLAVAPDHRLVLRYTPHRHVRPLGPLPPVREATLLEGVARLDLAYWPRTPPWGWTGTWDGPLLPALVRIRIVLPADDPRHWPEIVAAPMRAPAP